MEGQKINPEQIKAEVHLVDFLHKLGFSPVKKSGGELFYLSMLRDNDTAPSFCVNEKMDIWYDHGMGRGGSVIDLALLIWPQLPFREVMEKLLDYSMFSKAASKLPPRGRQMEMPLKFPSYQIKEDRPLGSNQLIAKYLSQRGILEVASPYLKELYYNIKIASGERKDMFAAGWQNELGGWEVRNEYFKGCLGKKSMSFIENAPDHLVVFEGMMDFLSWRKDHHLSQDSALILNSVAFLSQAIQRSRGYQKVSLFFDHDPSGRKATQSFLSSLSQARDCSEIYLGFNDYNEKTQRQISVASEQNNQSVHKSFRRQ